MVDLPKECPTPDCEEDVDLKETQDSDSTFEVWKSVCSNGHNWKIVVDKENDELDMEEI